MKEGASPDQTSANRSQSGAAIAAPDFSVEAEQTVLAAMLTQKPAIEAARKLLRQSDFYTPFHQVIFAAILTLRSHGEPVDFVTVCSELVNQERIDAAGGVVYLDGLLENCPAPVGHGLDLDAALRTVSEKAKKRAGAGRMGIGSARRKPIAERVVDLADVQPPGDLPLLFGQYLLKGNAHWLTGATGVGKSTLLFNLACALAEGTPLWGIECQQTKVLYADMESGDVGRAHKIERLYQGAPRVRDHLLFLREPVKLPDELDDLLSYVQAQEIALVVFDTARRVFAVRDENDNAEVYNRVIPTLDALKQIGVVTLTLGHPSKNGNGSARGAGAQEDAGDVNLTLTMHRGEVSDADGVIALRVTKNRLLGYVPPLFLRRVGGDQFERMDAALAGLPEISAEETAPSARELCAADIVSYLETSGPVRHGQIVEEMKQRGHAEGTAKKTVSWLQREERRIDNDTSAGGYILSSQ